MRRFTSYIQYFSFVCIIHVQMILKYTVCMKKIILITLLSIFLTPASFAEENTPFFKLRILNNDTREVKSLLNAQVRYANRNNFDKFINTYDKNYVNSDGFNLETYSNIVKDVWQSYDKIKYGIKIKNIAIKDDSAIVQIEETSNAIIPDKTMSGVLKSEADSVYHLKKVDGKWKVVYDAVNSENTSMLYGEAKDLDIKLTAPKEIEAGVEYTASLEFTPPENSIAIASIASDKVEYPQKQAKEVFRKLPDDNILERLFISNTDNVNEYIVASIGITKADITDLSVKFSLTGFGYQITRVNVKQKPVNEGIEGLNDESK